MGAGARLDRIDGMALLVLFVFMLVLCVVASFMEDAAERERPYELAEEARSPPASPRRAKAPRARERSPIWRALHAERARLQDAAM
jgi:Na+-transporting methylmalonyl-CoA/oxaloacetate decarboxylase gamma subunit